MGRIQLSYEELEAAHAQILAQDGEMTGTLQDLRTQLDGMDWEGEDKVTYEEAKAEWDEAFDWISQILEGIARAVNNAKERYAETEAANAARFG